MHPEYSGRRGEVDAGKPWGEEPISQRFLTQKGPWRKRRFFGGTGLAEERRGISHRPEVPAGDRALVLKQAYSNRSFFGETRKISKPSAFLAV